MTVPSISCPFCGITMQAVWYREKELDAHVFPQGEHTRRAAACFATRADTGRR